MKTRLTLAASILATGIITCGNAAAETTIRFFNSLSEDQQTLLMEVAGETVTHQRELAAEANAAALAEVEEKGLEVNELPAEARQSMGEAMNGAIKEDIRSSVGAEFYDAFMDNLQQ